MSARLPDEHLSTTARAILTEFADSFPESAHFRGGRKLRKGNWDRVFPRMKIDVETKEAFLDAVDELERRGLVSVKWQRFREGSEVDALYLEDAERLFELVGRASPETVREEMLAVLRGESWSGVSGSEIGGAVRDHLSVALEERHPIAARDADELRYLARLFSIGVDEARFTPIRALSVRVFGNSKRLEDLLPLADRLSRGACGAAVSRELGLARAYPEASLALRGAIVFRDGGERRRWVCDAEAVTLPAQTIERITALEFSRPSSAVLSVENKETFYSLVERLSVRLSIRPGALPPEICAVTYGGGHPHPAYINLLALCAAGGATLYHFGDLDPDGLLILSELETALETPVHPCLMNTEIYEAYLPYSYDPPPSRLELLAASHARLPAALRPLAEMILVHRKGVEQEVITVEGQGFDLTRG